MNKKCCNCNSYASYICNDDVALCRTCLIENVYTNKLNKAILIKDNDRGLAYVKLKTLGVIKDNE